MRRHLVLPVLLVSALVLAACGGEAATTTPDQTATETEIADEKTAPAATDEPTDEPASATEEEATADPTDTDPVAAGDCSAAGMSDAGADFGDLPDQVRATATLLLDAALRCDEQLLATAAFESDTQLTFGDADPYEFFALPEDETEVYAVITTLLTEVPHAAEADDATPATFVWPRVHTGDWAESDEGWQEVVDAGLLTRAEADDQRAAGSGYLGWRLGISGDGTWLFLVAGD